MDNNIESLIHEQITSNENNNGDIEKLLNEISISCLTQYDKDKLLQSIYYSHGSNIEYFREQLNNKIKDYDYQDKINQIDQLFIEFSNNINLKNNSLNLLENDINNFKVDLSNTRDKQLYNNVQIIFQSKVEKIRGLINENKIHSDIKSTV